MGSHHSKSKTETAATYLSNTSADFLSKSITSCTNAVNVSQIVNIDNCNNVVISGNDLNQVVSVNAQCAAAAIDNDATISALTDQLLAAIQKQNLEINQSLLDSDPTKTRENVKNELTTKIKEIDIEKAANDFNTSQDLNLKNCNFVFITNNDFNQQVTAFLTAVITPDVTSSLLQNPTTPVPIPSNETEAIIIIAVTVLLVVIFLLLLIFLILPHLKHRK